ncbi:hypothetical protein [Streptosporangium sp. NPDC087985]|uniref:hypothetical protein n=1 Tax=Streptosporangium sp. NPDC087985 TaxID=3366196 RepID=UPI003802E9BD
MTVIMLPGGVLRVPWAVTLLDGTRAEGTRDVRPVDADYEQWLAYALTEDEVRRLETEETARDVEILARWRARRSA